MSVYLVSLPFILIASFRSQRELWLVVIAGPSLYTLLYFGSQYVQFFKPSYILFAFLPVFIGLGIAIGNLITVSRRAYCINAAFMTSYLQAYEPFP